VKRSRRIVKGGENKFSGSERTQEGKVKGLTSQKGVTWEANHRSAREKMEVVYKVSYGLPGNGDQ